MPWFAAFLQATLNRKVSVSGEALAVAKENDCLRQSVTLKVRCAPAILSQPGYPRAASGGHVSQE